MNDWNPINFHNFYYKTSFWNLYILVVFRSTPHTLKTSIYHWLSIPDTGIIPYADTAKFSSWTFQPDTLGNLKAFIFFLILLQRHKATHLSLSIVNYANAVISFALLYSCKWLATWQCIRTVILSFFCLFYLKTELREL